MQGLLDWLGRLRDALQIDLFEISGTAITLMTALTAVFVIAATLVASRILRRLVRRAFSLRGFRDERTIGTVTRLLHYLLLILGFGIALQTLGINLSALFAAGAIFAVALGFAMQTVTQSYVAGVFVFSERAIRPSDILLLDDQVVRVLRLGIRATAVETVDGEHIMVPNDRLVSESIKNLTYDHSEVRINVFVGVAYSSDLDATNTALEAAAKRVSTSKRPHSVLLTEFGDSSVVFRVAVWTDDPWSRERFASRLRHEIWRSLKEAKVTIAFPQLDVHLDPDASITVARAA